MCIYIIKYEVNILLKWPVKEKKVWYITGIALAYRNEYYEKSWKSDL